MIKVSIAIAALIGVSFASIAGEASDWEEYKLTPAHSYDRFGYKDTEPVKVLINWKRGQGFWNKRKLHDTPLLSAEGLGACELDLRIKSGYAVQKINCEAGADGSSLYEITELRVGVNGEVVGTYHNMRNGRTMYHTSYTGHRIK